MENNKLVRKTDLRRYSLAFDGFSSTCFPIHSHRYCVLLASKQWYANMSVSHQKWNIIVLISPRSKIIVPRKQTFCLENMKSLVCYFRLFHKIYIVCYLPLFPYAICEPNVCSIQEVHVIGKYEMFAESSSR